MLEQLGPYKIQRRLGQGGMGTVYAAVHNETGATAAVKVLSTIQGTNSSLRARFDAEIETLKKLKHPNIVQLFGYGEQEGHLFYAMELVVGSSLHDLLGKGRAFTIAETIRWGIQVAMALKHAHDSGVIHRDLKPANLLLTETGDVKLADFGIAKLFGGTQLTADGGIIGTADYMAPEQAEGKPITSRCDLFSLGCVLYALLAGRPPFAGKTVPQVLHALRFDAHLPIRRVVTDAPPELGAIIDELLEKEPERRLPTALVVANRLRALEHGLAHRAKRVELDSQEDDDDYRLADDDRAQPKTVGDDRPTREFSLGPGTSASNAGPAPPTVIRTSPSGGALPVTSLPQDKTIADAPSPAAPSRFTTIADDTRRHERTATKRTEQSLPNWLMAVLLAVALTVIVSLIWFGNRPPSADSLYQQITAGDMENLDVMRGVERELDRFVELYPDDPRAEEVRGWKASLDADRQTRQLTRSARFAGVSQNQSLVERTYTEAMQLTTSQPELAAEKLERLLAVFEPGTADSGDAARVCRLARMQLTTLQATIGKQQAASVAELTARLDWADANAASDPDAARAIRRGIVELYREKPWAASIVERAQQEVK